MRDIEYSFEKTDLKTHIAVDWLQRSQWGKDRDPNLIAKSFRHSKICAAYSGGELIGFVRIVTDQCFVAYIGDLFVNHNWRNAGIGSDLIKNVVNHPHCKSVDNWIVTTTTANRFFAKLGFLPINSENNMACKRLNLCTKNY